MRKTEKKKLTLSKETITRLEVGKLGQAVGGTVQQPAFSDLWEQTTCMIVA
jgi:hypothetical protein